MSTYDSTVLYVIISLLLRNEKDLGNSAVLLKFIFIFVARAKKFMECSCTKVSIAENNLKEINELLKSL